MKYLLIPIDEIDSRIEELGDTRNDSVNTAIKTTINSLKSKGEIVEIEEIYKVEQDKFWNKDNPYYLFYGQKYFIKWLENEGYQLIKPVK